VADCWNHRVQKFDIISNWNCYCDRWILMKNKIYIKVFFFLKFNKNKKVEEWETIESKRLILLNN
jgi:hypothetical protein